MIEIYIEIIISAMRIPITKYGLPQVVIFPVSITVLMLVCFLVGLQIAAIWFVVAIEVILLILLIFVLSFFRDPKRTPPDDVTALLAPADGTIADIETVNEETFIKGPALHIGIFLSVFNTHINRMPCDVKVEKVVYKKGKFKDARHRLAGKINESNDLMLIRTKEPIDKLIVRQISGAIARRIVCKAKIGENFTNGEEFGMIKFGSRTELYIPMREDVQCITKIGDKVKAGFTILVKYAL